MGKEVPAVPGKGLKFARCLYFHWKTSCLYFHWKTSW